MPHHIMVFNDDQDTLEMYEMLLEFEGYTTEIHRGPHIDEREVTRVSPNLIILDWMYGHEERGLDVLHHLRSFLQTARTPIIVCTASGDILMSRYTELFQAEHIDVVHKPFQIDELTSVIARRLQ